MDHDGRWHPYSPTRAVPMTYEQLVAVAGCISPSNTNARALLANLLEAIASLEAEASGAANRAHDIANAVHGRKADR